MIDEPAEESAALYVLDLLEGQELAAFETRLKDAPELQRLVDGLREGAAALAHQAPSRALPGDLEQRVRAAIRNSPTSRRSVGLNWLPWALAASLLVSSAFLLTDRLRMKRRIAALERRDMFAQTQIAMLSSKLESAPRASAVIIWDSEKQEGVLKAIDVPKTAADRDYQLWVVDPQYKQPVSAGVFGVDASGATRINFKPQSKVSRVQAFAVSLERKGGVSKAEGPMVLVGK